MSGRTAILISCLQAESEFIHQQACAERRTLSGYVLRVVLGHVSTDENLYRSFPHASYSLSPWLRPGKITGPRTTFLVRCSRDESERIRAAARRRDVSISGYVLNALRRTWTIKLTAGGVGQPQELHRQHKEWECREIDPEQSRN